jgi:hypothetical protein
MTPTFERRLQSTRVLKNRAVITPTSSALPSPLQGPIAIHLLERSAGSRHMSTAGKGDWDASTSNREIGTKRGLLQLFAEIHQLTCDREPAIHEAH